MKRGARTTGDLFRYFFGSYPLRSTVMVCLMVAAGVAEGVGVVALIPVLQLATDGGTPEGRLGQAMFNAVAAIGLQPTLPTLLGFIVGAITLKTALLFLAQRQVGYTVAGVTRDLRLEMMRSLLEARWSYFLRKTPGQFANAIVSEARRASAAYQEACASIATLFQVLMYLLLAFLLFWPIALVALATGILSTALARRFFAMSRASGRLTTSASRLLASRLVDVLQGVKALKAMGREQLVWPLLEHETENLNLAKRTEVLAAQILRSMQEPLLTVILAAGLYFVLSAASLPLSSVLVLALVFYRAMGRINTLQAGYQRILKGESAFFAFRNELARMQANRDISSGTRKPGIIREGVRLENVGFSYGDVPVLEGVDAFIPAGAFVAVHGESGSGKTTLIDILAGLHQPSEGRVLIDGTPLGQFDMHEWRRSLGYVPQEVLLFNDTILNNVTLADRAYSREDAERALRAAGAWDFVAKKAGQLDHLIGERGGMLSGGERQRIALARALVGSPRLLILDEATSGLDPATEQAICRTLIQLRGQVTILSISHQLAMQEAADLVYVMREGGLELVEDKSKPNQPVAANRIDGGR